MPGCEHASAKMKSSRRVSSKRNQGQRKRGGRIKRTPLSVGCLLAATWLTSDKVGGAGVEILLRGFVGRGRGEELEGLEIVRLHLGVMRSGATATGEEEDGEEQDHLGDDGSQVTDDGVRRGVIDELLTAIHQDDRQENRENKEHPAHQAVALGSAAKDFGSRGRRGAGHSGSD